MVEYSFLTGLLKTAKNSVLLLVPFIVAVLIGVPAEYGWVTGPIVYFLNNLYQNKYKS